MLVEMSCWSSILSQHPVWSSCLFNSCLGPLVLLSTHLLHCILRTLNMLMSQFGFFRVLTRFESFRVFNSEDIWWLVALRVCFEAQFLKFCKMAMFQWAPSSWFIHSFGARCPVFEIETLADWIWWYFELTVQYSCAYAILRVRCAKYIYIYFKKNLTT